MKDLIGRKFKRKYNFPLRFPDTYPESIESKMETACGPGKFGDKFVPDTIYGLCMTEPCRIHDHSRRMAKTLKDKQQGDIDFLLNMIITAINYMNWLFTLRVYRAASYFIAVWKHGNSNF